VKTSSLRRRDLLKMFGSTAATMILVSACGGAQAPAAPTAPAAAPATAPTAASAAAPTTASAAAPTTAPAAAGAAAAAPTTAPAAGAAAAPTTAPAAGAAAAPTTAPAAGAAGAATPTPNPLASVPIKPGLKVVEWWFGWGGMTALTTFATLGKDFNTQHNDFQIKPLQVATITEKLLAAIAGGTAPSVETGNITFAQFWITGAAQPLDDYLKASKVIDQNDIFPAAIQAGQWKGKTYGVSAVEGFLRWGLSFNTDFLAKANIPVTQLPSDFDTLYQFAKQATVIDSSGAVKALGIDVLDAMGGSFGDGDPFYWPAAYGFKYYDEAQGKYNFNNDQMIAAMTMIQKFYDIAGAEKIQGFIKAYGSWTESPTSMFPSGVEAANINGYWAPGELAKSAPGRHFVYGWVPTIQKGQKLQSTGGHYGMLPKGGPDPDLGFKVIEYLNTDPAMQIIFDGTGWIGAHKSFLSKINVKQYEGLDFFVNSADTASPMWQVYVDPIQAFVSDQFSKIIDTVNFHKTTPKDAAAQLQQAADTEMKNQFPNGV
jgi:hypothetical protein